MITYKLSTAYPQHHLLDVEVTFPNVKEQDFILQLPSWRPGRYELGNFAKNIQKFAVFNEKNKALEFEKITKDCWKVRAAKSTTVVARYTYFAADLNAGSTFVDTEQVYVNPVNCCMYNPSRMDEAIEVILELPSNYQVACSMSKKNKHTLRAAGFEELADSPFIASPTLKHFSFNANTLPVHVWFQGECRPDEKRITEDFKKFSQWQLDVFKKCPAKEYHYLIQILPFTFYHGVEHTQSTVLALGPGHGIDDVRYDELLGVACHEFYHVWNIKTIRPAEMHPYDYTKENYFPTGFVAEGVTTYMGDYILWQSDVFTTEQYFNELNTQFQKHFDNGGRFNYSVVQSGFDNWLDGYVPGVPDRKVSIYVEGCLIALMTDIIIMKNTNMKKNLHDVMRKLYNEFYLKNKGYTYEDYSNVVSFVADRDMRPFFDKYAKGTADFKPMLQECLSYIGLELNELNGPFHETRYGFKMSETPDKSVVTAIHLDSPAYKQGLAINDQIISVNGYVIKDNAFKWVDHLGKKSVSLDVLRAGKLIRVDLKTDGKSYYKIYRLKQSEKISKEQKMMFDYWKKKK